MCSCFSLLHGQIPGDCLGQFQTLFFLLNGSISCCLSTVTEKRKLFDIDIYFTHCPMQTLAYAHVRAGQRRTLQAVGQQMLFD